MYFPFAYYSLYLVPSIENFVGNLDIPSFWVVWVVIFIIISWKLCLLPSVVSYQCIFNLSLYINSFLLVGKHAHISSYSLINEYKIIFKIPFPFSHIPVLCLIVKLFWKSWEMANLTQPMSVPLISEVSPRSDPDQVCAHNQSTIKVIAFMQPTLSKYRCR